MPLETLEMPAALDAKTAPAAAPSTPAPESSPIDEAYSSLDGYAKEQSADVANPPPAPADRQRKKLEEPPPKKEEAPEPKKEEAPPEKTQPKAEEKPATPPKQKKPSDFLREKLAQVEQERNNYKTELEKIKTAKPSENPELKALQERLETESKARQRLEDELKYADYSRSDEFKEKYQQPFIDAYNNGRAKVNTFRITDAEGNVRQATDADFDRIMTLNDEEAAEKAVELFGTKANIVLWHREKILDLNSRQLKAVEDFKKTGSERDKARMEQMSQQSKKNKELFDKLNTEAAEKYPHLFKPIEGDEKGNELLKKGYDRADFAFSSEANKLPPEQVVALHSEIRNKAAAFPRLTYQLKAARDEVARLKAELEAFEGSEPKAAEGEGKKAEESTVDTMDGLLDELDKRAKDVL